MYLEDKIMLRLGIACVLGAFTCTGTCMSGCDPDYAEGSRIGIVYKLSQKGVIWKTWEGEMNLGGAAYRSEGGAVPNVWSFTVVNQQWLSSIEDAMNQGYPVKFHYRQWWIAKYPRTESGYEIVKVERVKQ